MQFDAVARGLGAEPGDNGYYRGIANTAPFLYKQTSAVPSGYMFKFRRFTIPLPAAPRPRSVGVQPEWHDTLSSEYANAGVRSEVDYDYLYLWIDDPRQLTAASVVALVAACVQAHSQYFPHVGQYCSSCRSTGKATLVQNGSSVTTICSDCLDRKRQDVLAKNQSLNASDARVSLLLPLALVLGSLGWAVCWTLYDTIFRITKSNWIVVPTVLVMLVATGVGFGLGWPIGQILRRSGATKRFRPQPLAVISSLLMVVFGEIAYASYQIFEATGSLNPELIYRATLPLALGGNIIYAGYK